MKIFLKIKSLFLFCFLVFTTQCSTDKPDMKPVALITSASQLASDTSFVALVQMNRKVTNKLFNKMRMLGSNEARKQQASKIAQLIKESGTHNRAKELGEQFGFANEYDFKNSIFVLLTKKVELNNRYSNFANVDYKLQKQADN